MVDFFQHSNNLSTGHSSAAEPAGDPLTRACHTAVAVALGFILVLGFLGNFLVLLVFSRFPRLHTPMNLLLINISASDMLVCIFGTPLSFAANVRGKWLTGQSGCRWYGFSNALFGIVSVASFSLLSLERYSAVLWNTRTSSSQYHRAKIAVATSWFYSLFWTLPPLFGWSSYGPEGLGTTCSVRWQQRTAASRSYVSCLFIFCLLLPLLLMIFCYGRILLTLRAVSRRAGGATGERRETRVLLMVVCMVAGYLLCWMPYGIVAMLASFGPPGVVPPTASLIPSLLAKTSTVLNPVIYVRLNHQFCRCFLYMIGWSSEATPTPVNQTGSACKGAWLQVPSLPGLEQNPAAATFKTQQGCSVSGCSVCNVDLKDH